MKKSGEIIINNKEGKISSVFSYVGLNLHGEYILYLSTGDVFRHRYFENDMEQGEQLCYDNNTITL